MSSSLRQTTQSLRSSSLTQISSSRMSSISHSTYSKANVNGRSRGLSHEDFSNHLCGRFYVSPSRLYSSVRLQPDKQGYDIPVPGDWVTIAVVAERGPVRMTRAPVALGPDEDAVDPANKWKKAKTKGEFTKPHGKHFISLKLVDFGARAKSSASAGKEVIRGDAFLSLLLFESDAVEKVTGVDGRVEKVYRGGSRGAYEMFDKLKAGDVVALLNPKVLKPYQVCNSLPSSSMKANDVFIAFVGQTAPGGQHPSSNTRICVFHRRAGKSPRSGTM